MEFEVLFYTDNNERNPVQEFLDRLKITNRALWQQAVKGIEKLRHREYHREPLSKYLEPRLWELRIRARTDIVRIFYTFAKGQIIVLLHIFIKKQKKTPTSELEMARKRLKIIKAKEMN